MSDKEHASYNQAFFAAVKFRPSIFYIFNHDLEIKGQNNKYVRSSRSRFSRFLAVFMLHWRHRYERILLLTYDPVLVIFLQFFSGQIIVLEHNTTPEKIPFSKHAVWQRLFFHSITRLSQYPTQHDRLKDLGQDSHYFGSPLEYQGRVGAEEGSGKVFLAMSARVNADQLLNFASLVGDAQVVVKRSALSEEDLQRAGTKLNLVPLSWLDMKEWMPRAIALIVTVSSCIRGSGWFNEGIKHQVPLVITDSGAGAIFERTFPAYPFVEPSEVKTSEQLRESLRKIEQFDGKQYVDEYNASMRKRFEDAIGGVD